MDIIVVRQPDGSLKSSPFHVRFGKFRAFKGQSRKVQVIVNGVECTKVEMVIGKEGEAFFMRDVSDGEMATTNVRA